MKPKKLQILKVWIEQKDDQINDCDDLGMFTDEPDDDAIIRFGEHAGELVRLVHPAHRPEKGRQFRFFVPAMTAEQTGNSDSPIQDWKRAEALERGQWVYTGIIAKAEIRNPGTSVVQTIHSGGLWAIESDSDADYLTSVALEELAGLDVELQALGLGRRAIAYAINRAQSPFALARKPQPETT